MKHVLVIFIVILLLIICGCNTGSFSAGKIEAGPLKAEDVRISGAKAPDKAPVPKPPVD